MKKQLFLMTLIAFTMHDIAAFDTRKFFNAKNEEAQKTEASQWAFLEQTFILDTHAAKQSIWNHVNRSLPAAVAAFAWYKYCMPEAAVIPGEKLISTLTKTFHDGTQEIHVLTEPKNKAEKDFIKDALSLNNLYLVGGAVATAWFTTQAAQCYLNSYFNRQIVENFLKNWKTNRSLTPVEFHNAFDALSNIMDINGDDAVLDHANEIVDMMQFMIMRHFEKRYEKALAIQSINNLDGTKNILDVLKTAIDTAKGLA